MLDLFATVFGDPATAMRARPAAPEPRHTAGHAHYGSKKGGEVFSRFLDVPIRGPIPSTVDPEELQQLPKQFAARAEMLELPKDMARYCEILERWANRVWIKWAENLTRDPNDNNKISVFMAWLEPYVSFPEGRL